MFLKKSNKEHLSVKLGTISDSLICNVAGGRTPPPGSGPGLWSWSVLGQRGVCPGSGGDLVLVRGWSGSRSGPGLSGGGLARVRGRSGPRP